MEALKIYRYPYNPVVQVTRLSQISAYKIFL